MVKKNGKHGVRSGNTLRASNSRYNKQYLTDSCIVRKSSNLSRRQSNQVADDALIDADGVLYSLNKKGRWALPEMIKENIQDEEEIKVSIYQRHKISRPSNCVDYSSNKGIVKSCVAKHGYFNGASVKSERKGRGERKKKIPKQTDQKDGTGDEEPLSDPDPEITYDVYYPSPVTSSITHNPKYIRNAEVIVYDDGEVREVGHGRKKKGGRHRVNVVPDEPEYYSDTEQFDSFDDQFSENEEISAQNEDVCSPEVLLIDILESAERAKELCYKKPEKRKVKRKKTKSEHCESEWVLVSEHAFEDEAYNTTEEESTTSDASLTASLTPSPKLESVRIILQCDTVHPHQLKDTFKDRYIEAACQPRKFIIDTTEDVTKALKRSKSANMLFLGSLDLTSCLVFSRDASYDTGLDVYSVKFNISCTVDTVRIETLFDLMSTTVEEVIQAAADYSTTLSPDCFPQLEVGAIAPRQLKEMSMPFVPAVCHWKTQSISLRDVKEHDFELVSEKDIKGAAAAAPAEEKDEERRPEYCNICFEEISPELMESASATSLQRCGHWFCDGCWKEHMSERIHSGAQTVKCPEYDCSAVVDTGTLLSIANVKHVKLHQHLKATNDVESNENLKWCPNPKCGRVLMRGKCIKDTVTVNCECGKVTCFNCLGDAHWPATCQQTLEYSQQLNRCGDDTRVVENVNAVVVRGKKCPKCQRYIEKDGGCIHMQCVCGFRFCWACCQSWLTHQSYVECSREPDTYNTSQKIVRHIDTSIKEIKSAMYKIAIENRLQRKPQYTRIVKANMNALSLQLRTLMTKGVDIGQRSIVTNDSSTLATPAAVHEFLVQMVQLKMELNHVIEHTSVFLDRRQNKTGSRKLIQACESFQDLTLSIESIFKSKGKQELMRVLPTLSQLRTLAQRRVVALVKLLAKFETPADR